MKAGDFTDLAENYRKYRPNYSNLVLDAIIKHCGFSPETSTAVDCGAGTGIWTQMLREKGFECTAVEPNSSMLTEGTKFTDSFSDLKPVKWIEAPAEETHIADGHANWVTMASSFHWTELEKALAEFHRILKPGGYLTVLWNPRNIAGNELHENIENEIYKMVPNLKRKSSGNSKHVRDYHSELTTNNLFGDVIFMEACHSIEMSKERYMGAWRSVNDIQVQAGPERWQEILKRIEEMIAPLDGISVPYKTRSWTVRRL